jgi:hypothetical protein
MATKKGSGSRAPTPRKKDARALPDGWRTADRGPCIVCGRDASFEDPEGRRRHDGCKPEAPKCGLCLLEAGAAVGTNRVEGTRPRAHSPGCSKDVPAAPIVSAASVPPSGLVTASAFYALRLAYRELRSYVQGDAAEFGKTVELIAGFGTELLKLEEIELNGAISTAAQKARTLFDGAADALNKLEALDRQAVKGRLEGFKALADECARAVAIERAGWMERGRVDADRAIETSEQAKKIEELEAKVEALEAIETEHESCPSTEEREAETRELLEFVLPPIVDIALDRGASPVDVWAGLRDDLAIDVAKRACDRHVPSTRTFTVPLGFAPPAKVAAEEVEKPEKLLELARAGKVPRGWTLGVGKGPCVFCEGLTSGRTTLQGIAEEMWVHFECASGPVCGTLTIEKMEGKKVTESITLPNTIVDPVMAEIVQAPERKAPVVCKADREEPAPAPLDLSTALGDF